MKTAAHANKDGLMMNVVVKYKVEFSRYRESFGGGKLSKYCL